MLSGKSIRELGVLIQAGASLEVDGDLYSTDELQFLASMIAAKAGVTLKIHNSGSRALDDLRAIAFRAGGKVTFG